MVQRNDRGLDIDIMRELTRTLFKFILVALAVAGCTQSVTWLGEVAPPYTHQRYNPNYKTQKAEPVYQEYNNPYGDDY